MTGSFDLILKGGTVMLPEGAADVDVAVRDGRVAAIGSGLGGAAAEVDVSHLHVLPGVIDTQVHFREPGLEHKEDLTTGSLAAVLGGVTAVFDMPNTKPPTISLDALINKQMRASGRMWCDFAFFAGATAENIDEIRMCELLSWCAGVKMFMGSSTGDLLVDHEADMVRVLAGARRRVAVHCEDEARLRARYRMVDRGAPVSRHPAWRDARTALAATKRLLRLAEKAWQPVHVLHVTTAEEMELLARHRDLATVEVTPQHLTLTAPECYERLGTLAQMNPPIRDKRHRAALWQALTDGLVDCIGSDHAPHTLEEKARPYPQSPSGMPGVQTLLPVMLDHVAAGRLSLARLVDLTSAGPARIYDIEGKGAIAVGLDADLTVVDLKTRRTVTRDAMASRCGWSPFEGMTLTGWPVMTVVRGCIVMRDGEAVGEPAGQSVRFRISL
ncbi:MAG: dihydroorotase [Alphaproteobacteria bacterium]